MIVFAPSTMARPAWIARSACVCIVAAALVLAACSGSSRSTVTAPVGTTAGVALSSSTGTTQIQQSNTTTSHTMVITASVTVDPNKQGVTWLLNGLGAISNLTTTTVTYTAPTGITGTTTPVITATSIYDTAQNSAVTLVVLGDPVIDPSTVLFPGNVNTAYGASVIVSGGLGPYTWALDASSAALPAGITLGTTLTSAFTTLSGTPTTLGTYPFTIDVTDANGKKSTVALSLTINGAEACLLTGQYAVLYSGYDSGQMSVLASSLNISATGTITGYQDFGSPGTPDAESVTGTCTTRTANNGTLAVTGTGFAPQYDYAVTRNLQTGRVQLQNGGDRQSGSGLIEKQDPTAFNLASLAGSYAFGALGAQADANRAGVAGTLSVNAGGVITGGHMDANGSGTLTDAVLTGTCSAPDTNGRGTLTLTATPMSGSNQNFQFSYYVVDVTRVLIVSTNTALRLSGFMTRQSGTFDNTSLASPGILSLWGAVASAAAPKTVLDLGRLHNANASAGTLDVNLDSANELTFTLDKLYASASYAVRTTDGRATLSLVSGTTTRNLVLYLYGTAGGYVVEQGSPAGSGGLLEAQTGPFTTTIPGLFVSGTQFPEDVAPMLLLPSVQLAAGTFSSTNASGYYALDTTTGRAVGTITATGSGAAVFSIYVIGPNKIVTLRYGAQNRSSVIDWLGS